MNLEAIKASLRKHEDVRPTVYTDTVGVLTLAVGHNCTRPISMAAIEQILSDDVNTAIDELDKHAPWYKTLPEAQQNVLVELSFAMGWPRLSEFKLMLAALQSGDRAEAARQLDNSKWATQVGARAITLAEQIRNG